MNIKAKIVSSFIIIVLCFLGILTSLTITMKDPIGWCVNVFSDKTYVLRLTPLYLFFTSYIDKYFLISRMIRIGDRKKALLTSLTMKIIFAFLYLSLWFILVIGFTWIKFPSNYELSFLGIFFKFFIGYAMLILFSEIFKRSSGDYISKMAHLNSYLILLIEVFVIKGQISMHSHYHFNFIFTWFFYDSFWSFLAITIIITMLLTYLFKVSIEKDILR